jgi:hypothetical protein
MQNAWFAPCLLLFLASAAQAQQAAAAPPSPAYEKCLVSAVLSEDVYKTSSGVEFRCFGSAAEAWFKQLPGGKEIQDPNGVFVARYFEQPGYCAHQTKSASGAAVSTYLCAITRPPLK